MIYYVNSKVENHGNGSKEKPFKTINEAAQIAVAGDEVIVAPGVYREWVNPVNGGTEDKRIVYKSEVPLGDRKSTRNSSHHQVSRMPSSA